MEAIGNKWDNITILEIYQLRKSSAIPNKRGDSGYPQRTLEQLALQRTIDQNRELCKPQNIFDSIHENCGEPKSLKCLTAKSPIQGVESFPKINLHGQIAPIAFLVQHIHTIRSQSNTILNMVVTNEPKLLRRINWRNILDLIYIQFSV